MKSRLNRIAIKYGTDKSTSCGDSHGYTLFYEPYLECYERPVILELGTFHGASAKMFHDYYDGECEIYTVDIASTGRDYVAGISNVTFIQADISNKKGIDFLKSQLGNKKFDIIIDDCSHISEHQFLALYWLNDMLKKDGIYILEDIHFSRVWNQDPLNTPLFFSTFLFPVPFYTEEENRNLIERVNDVFLYSHKNLSTSDMRELWGGRSMTAIITFNDTAL